MKTLFLLLVALFLASCAKQNESISGTFRLYNDASHVTEMTVLPHSVSFTRDDTLIGVSEYSGDLFGESFAMPAGVWHNDNVLGRWSVRGAFLEFTYTAENRDSLSAIYIPNQTYELDFFKP